MSRDDKNLNDILLGVCALCIPAKFAARAVELCDSPRDEKIEFLGEVLTHLGSKEHLALFKEIRDDGKFAHKFTTKLELGIEVMKPTDLEKGEVPMVTKAQSMAVATRRVEEVLEWFEEGEQLLILDAVTDKIEFRQDLREEEYNAALVEPDPSPDKT